MSFQSLGMLQIRGWKPFLKRLSLFLGAGLQPTAPEEEYAKLSKCGQNICSGSGNLILGILSLDNTEGFPESLELLGMPWKIQLGNPLDWALCLPI